MVQLNKLFKLDTRVYQFHVRSIESFGGSRVYCIYTRTQDNNTPAVHPMITNFILS